MAFKKATKSTARLRLALIGPSGSGKTYTALNIARHLGGRIALIDTERGSASKYAGTFQFDTQELDDFDPRKYVAAIHEAEEGGYDVLVIDSLSHAWAGKGGALEMVDKVAKRQQANNTFGAWREVTPIHNALVDAIVGSKLHIIATIRSKMEHVQEKDEKTGKTVVRKIGLQPIQRDQLEFEFDVIGDLTMDHDLVIGKTRCEALDGQVYRKAGADVAAVLQAWLTDGEPAAAAKSAPITRPTVVPTPQPAEDAPPESAPETQPEEPVDPHAPTCHECHEPVRAVTINGKPYTVDAIVDTTVARYGHALCAACSQKRRKAG